MKRSFLIAALFASFTVPAIAADLPARPLPPAPVMAPYLSWNGFYIGGNLGYSKGRTSRDISFFDAATGEGIVAKRIDSPYRSGRSKTWIKVKNPNSPAALRIEEGTF